MKKTITILAILFFASCSKEKQTDCKATVVIKNFNRISHCLYINNVQQNNCTSGEIEFELPIGTHWVHTLRESNPRYYGFADSIKVTGCDKLIMYH
jgi:hypothetical protein